MNGYHYQFHPYLNLSEYTNKSKEELTAEELHRFERLRLLKQHEGHETMHAEMVFILLLTISIAQIILIEWKRRAYRSYQFVTLLALWIIPLGFSLRYFWWRFVIVWLIFSCITGLVLRKAFEKPIQVSTPRLVFKWFYLVHVTSFVLGIVGYVHIMLTLFSVNRLFGVSSSSSMDAAMLVIYYALYYGVMCRDAAEVASERLAKYRAASLPQVSLAPNLCAVCGHPLLVPLGERGVIEDSVQLPCSHSFHEFCIRGWCLIGKKHTCPYCHDKVDLKRMFKNPWERPHILFGQLLDWIRLLVAWQPIIFGVVNLINYVLDLK